MDSAMPYSRLDQIPDLSDAKLCGFCRHRVPDGTSDYCDKWCADQDDAWWKEIHVSGVARKDPLEGRQWFTLGGDGL